MGGAGTSGGGSSVAGSNHNLPSIPPPPPHICITSPSRLSNHLISVGEVGSLFISNNNNSEDTLSYEEDYDDDYDEEQDEGRRNDHHGDLL